MREGGGFGLRLLASATVLLGVCLLLKSLVEFIRGIRYAEGRAPNRFQIGLRVWGPFFLPVLIAVGLVVLRGPFGWLPSMSPLGATMTFLGGLTTAIAIMRTRLGDEVSRANLLDRDTPVPGPTLRQFDITMARLGLGMITAGFALQMVTAVR